MKWKSKPEREVPLGANRIVKRFLLFPTKIANETRWLEFAWIKQQWCLDLDYICPFQWIPIAFVDDPKERDAFWESEARILHQLCKDNIISDEERENEAIRLRAMKGSIFFGNIMITEELANCIDSSNKTDVALDEEDRIKGKKIAEDIDRQAMANISQKNMGKVLSKESSISSEEIPKEYIKTLIGKDKPVVFDIGAYDGKDLFEISEMYDNGVFFAIEAEERNIPLIRKSLGVSFLAETTTNNSLSILKSRNSGIRHLFIFNSAVSDYEGSVDFYQSKSNTRRHKGHDFWSASSSTKKPKSHLDLFPDVQFEEKTMVECTTLDIIYRNLNNLNLPIIEIIDFIWCDVNGSEEDVIRGGAETLANTRYLYIEFSDKELYEGQVTKEELMALIPDFELIGIYNFRGNFGNILLRNKKL